MGKKREKEKEEREKQIKREKFNILIKKKMGIFVKKVLPPPHLK